ncbi:MAG TPA: polysaccharide deacetylase family protein [Solirubrobacteraceae bacterium]|nr:polysaccharide deacetylase family protein [Solirubrobacteraceae bacterium]
MRKLPSLALLFVVLLLAGCGSTHTTGSTNTRPPSKSRRSTSAVGRQTSSAKVTNATPQPGWRHYTGGVPILVYHDLGNPPPTENYPGLYVSYANFEAEMAWLHQQGYQAVTLDEMMNDFFHGGTLPAKPIVITFDNGYIPQATFAPSVMEKYGWPGVLNEITVDHLNNTRLKHLVSLGWEVDSHSLTHPDLTQATPAELQQQVVDSRRFLQRVLHVPVDSFCYPSNRYNATVEAAVKAAGYTNALTENPGFATAHTDPFQLPRFEIEGGLSQLQADLASGG